MSKLYFGKPSFLMAVISGILWAAGVALLGLVIKSLEQALDQLLVAAIVFGFYVLWKVASNLETRILELERKLADKS